MSDAMPVVKVDVDPALEATIRAEAENVLKMAEGFAVVDADSHRIALDLGERCLTYSKRWDDLFREGASMADRLHKWFTRKIGSVRDPLRDAKTALDRKAYQWEKSERERLANEERRRQEAERRKIEEERLRQAEILAEKGHPELADRVMEKPIEVAPQEIKVERPQGTIARENWQFEVVDENLIPREFLMPNLMQIGKVVRAMKGGTKIPGIRCYDAGVIARRTV